MSEAGDRRFFRSLETHQMHGFLGLMGGRAGLHLACRARGAVAVAAAGYEGRSPWLRLGIGLDFGSTFVGNVGS